jgi:hypothetical protein
MKTTYTAAGKSLATSRDVRVREARIEDRECPKLRDFFEQARAADAVEIKMMKRLMKSAAR